MPGIKVVDSSAPNDDADWVLKFNDIDLMLNTAFEKHEQPVDRDQNRMACHADATLYFGCEDIETAYVQLRKKGLDLPKPTATS